MSEFTFTFEEDIAEEAEVTGGTFGTLDTGIYGVTINFASLGQTAKGNNTIALDITTDDGHQTTIWSAFGTMDKTWASGAENFAYKDFMSFMGACGAKIITPTPFSLKKDDGTIIKDFEVDDVECVNGRFYVIGGHRNLECVFFDSIIRIQNKEKKIK